MGLYKEKYITLKKGYEKNYFIDPFFDFREELEIMWPQSHWL